MVALRRLGSSCGIFLAAVALGVACGDDDGATPGSDGGGTADAGPRPDGSGGVDGGGPGADGGGGGECALAVPFDVGATYTTTLHVAESGDDGNDGSEGAPLATIRAAASRATPGTRIVVHAGTYAGGSYIDGLAGEMGRPIAIVGEGGPVIDVGAEGEGLHLTDPQWVVLEGLTIRNAPANGINVDDGGSSDTPAHHVVFRNLTIADVGTGGNNDCLKMSGVDDFFIVGNDISNCTGQMIDMVGCHDGVIAGNTIHDSPESGVQAKGGSSDVLIHGNVFTDVAGRNVNAGGSTGLEFFRPIDATYEGARIHVVSNVFVRPGMNSGAPIAYVGCDACVFANNTVIEPRTWVARILQETTDARFVPSRDGWFVNNVVVFRLADLRTFVNVGAGTAPETFTFGNNLWWAVDEDASWPGPTLDGVPPESGSIVQMDPLFVSREGGDYHIQAGSPAAGAGGTFPSFPPYPDFDGNCWAEPRAIGAFEAP